MPLKKKRILIITAILAILILLSGWLVFSKAVRPRHYQLLRPYSVRSGEKLAATETRIGRDGALQIYIPAGSAVLGTGDRQTEADLPGYWIRQIPVTLKEYKKYAPESGALRPHYRDEYLAEYDGWWNELKPVTFISWEEADSYCRWYGGHLPTEAQWEKAARGTGGTVLYWDEEVSGYTYANYGSFYSGKTPAGWLPKGVSPYGLLDMAGNVREWVLDPFLSDEQPVDLSPWQEIRAKSLGEAARMLKGGGFSDDLSHLRLYRRDSHDPNSPGLIRGFRCVFEEDNDTEK